MLLPGLSPTSVLFVYLGCLYLFVWGQGLLCSPGQAGTHYVDGPSWSRTQRELPSAGTKGVAPIPGCFFFQLTLIVKHFKNPYSVLAENFLCSFQLGSPPSPPPKALTSQCFVKTRTFETY